MANLLIKSCLRLLINIFEHFIALFYFLLKCIPGISSILFFIQCFCLCKNSLKFCSIYITSCSLYNISVCSLEIICIIIVSKRHNFDCPISGSIISVRKLASYRFCQTKLNTHGFVHPVICCKFCSIGSNRSAICGVISIICPLNSLHSRTKSAIVTIQINTKEFTIRTICLFYCWLNTFSCFKFCILQSRIGTVLSCCKAEGSICIFNSFF